MAFNKEKKIVPPKEFSSEGTPTHPGKYGDHPIGGAVGAAVGAAAGAAAVGAAQGAALGTPGGVPGMAAGIAVGGVVGALAGKGLAQKINPTTEDAYWSYNYKFRPYVQKDETYDTYRNAYQHGISSFVKYEGRPYDEVEVDLSRDWSSQPDYVSLPWDKAKNAARDAYERLHKLHKE